ncbi:hypothetical protein PHYPSEUDO_005092 [Phytophthora pseudosyringae]|uniref:Uncharacterized protein n=1 Tax=Phytophthora pseudosyringae TaxID=221518 RepID=A0A8T1VQI1_9STRA|nr:hypothetical protein PHYPSEUDO_005092 [Phytophthora pseudosyringae]
MLELLSSPVKSALEALSVLEDNEISSKEDEPPEALASVDGGDVGVGVVALGAVVVTCGDRVVGPVDEEDADELEALPLEVAAAAGGTEVDEPVIVSAVAIAASAMVSAAALMRDARMILR